MASHPIVHGLSIDVEDWFHILDCEGSPDTSRWAELPSRVERNTGILLDLFDRHRVKATFFCLGWVAEHFPTVPQEIVRRGHELGSHSHLHGLVGPLGAESFARDLDTSLQALQHATGTTIKCFRAPGFSLTRTEVGWALPLLASRGIDLDSSLFLTDRAHGGLPLGRQDPFTIQLHDGHKLLEVPVIPRRFGNRDLAFSGGGYLRLLPLPLLRASFAEVERQGHGAVCYLHPREIDIDQPRMPLPPQRAFKYYVGLGSVMAKLEALLQQFHFGTLRQMAERNPRDRSISLDNLLRG